MGNIMSMIRDDINEYLELCKEFGEVPVCRCGTPDPYGEHAEKLYELRDARDKARFGPYYKG